MNPGTFKIIRTGGTETIIKGKASVAEISRLIGASALDTVTIGRKRQTIMFVDDTGMLDHKPVNAKATALYHAICKPNTVHKIHGDVVIVLGGDLHAES